MVTESLIPLFEKSLYQLEQEITAYPNDDALWETEMDIKNSGGNLCLHLLGNLQHFIGAILGDTGYVRKREAEFTDKNIDIEDLLSELRHTQEIVVETLKNLSSYDLEKTYPIPVFGYDMKTEYFLIHLHSHLNYHLGQINYHRRLID